MLPHCPGWSWWIIGRLFPHHPVAALQEGDAKRELLKRPGPMARYLTARYGRLDQEVMGALYVDVRDRLLVVSEIFRGTLVRAAVEPRPILREALEHGAAGLVPWHTHPSGDPTPSTADLGLTRRLAVAADALGVTVLDHLVLGGGGSWISLKRLGGW